MFFSRKQNESSFLELKLHIKKERDKYYEREKVSKQNNEETTVDSDGSITNQMFETFNLEIIT